MIKRIESRPETLEDCKKNDEWSAVELEHVIDDAIRKHEHFDLKFDYDHDRPEFAPKIIFRLERFTVNAIVKVVSAYKEAGWNIAVFGSELHLQW